MTRGRRLRGGATGRFLQPLLWVGPYRPPLQGSRQVCFLCRGPHRERPPVPRRGVQGGEGRSCPHGQTKCANCGGPHGARADACAAKRTARQLARVWKTPPPPRRERKTPGAEATAAQGEGESGEADVEAREEGGSAQAREGMELGD